MPLEDDLCDIIKKSRLGRGLSVGDLARLTGLPGADIVAIERGDQPRDRDELRALAQGLGLRAASLEQIALDHWTPRPLPTIEGVDTVQGEIGGYAVKGYVIHDGGEALLVDTAYNAPAMLKLVEERGWRVVGIGLTHGHADHSEGIELMLNRWNVPVYLGADDLSLLGWRPPTDRWINPEESRTIAVGRLLVRCLLTPGHTPGGICYQTETKIGPLCFVGDTLFAGSIGKSSPLQLYQTHLQSVRTRVLSLSKELILLPGHGPGTTVAEELEHNPFHAHA